MSFPKLPTCPAWCASEHARAGSPHLKNLGQVGRVAGHLEAEANLVEDEQGPHVQLIVTDYSIPANSPIAGERTTSTRIPIDVASTVGHIATYMDVRGVIEVGQLLHEAWDIYNTYQQRCRFTWCVADHDEPGWERTHVAEPVHVGGVKVTAMFSDDPDPIADVEGVHAFVRLNFGDGMSHEIRPLRAADMADALARIDVGEIDRFVEVLREAAAKLGVER